MAPKMITVLCNGAALPKKLEPRQDRQIERLEYDPIHGHVTRVNLRLADFVSDVLYLPPRVLDLLEIAAFVFAADRSFRRGRKDAVEFQAWSRRFQFVVKVRDIQFWKEDRVISALREALCYISGDQDIDFFFKGGHSTQPTSLFDKANISLPAKEPTTVCLFSGGLDSLAGVIQQLETTNSHICVMSHQSGQPSTAKTQNKLFDALTNRYPGRVSHFKFACGLTGQRASEESQRTRSFLYSAVAFAMCVALKKDSFFVFENGVTSINFPRRQDLINARASRTTHPYSLHLLANLYSIIFERNFEIINPYFQFTKTDVIRIIKTHERTDLISSTVSCSRTFKTQRGTTHCGECSQCIDRRIAVHAAELEKTDNVGLYSFDIFSDEIKDLETKTTLIDYIRQAKHFWQSSDDKIYKEHLREIYQISRAFPSQDEPQLVSELAQLCRRHGEQVLRALGRVREIHDALYEKTPKNSLLQMINEREYLEEPVTRLVSTICRRLQGAIPKAFQSQRPTNENHLNDVIESLLESNAHEFRREHPAILFGLARAIPDHSLENYQLLIEAKYLRKGTPPSKASEWIAADLTKYPENSYKLFIVYDPDRAISDDEIYRRDFERKPNCKILVAR